MKLLSIIQELEKPKNIYNPEADPDNELEKDIEISSGGEVKYYDNIRTANAFKTARKELYQYNKKNPGKLPKYNDYYKAIGIIINALTKLR